MSHSNLHIHIIHIGIEIPGTKTHVPFSVHSEAQPPRDAIDTQITLAKKKNSNERRASADYFRVSFSSNFRAELCCSSPPLNWCPRQILLRAFPFRRADIIGGYMYITMPMSSLNHPLPLSQWHFSSVFQLVPSSRVAREKRPPLLLIARHVSAWRFSNFDVEERLGQEVDGNLLLRWRTCTYTLGYGKRWVKCVSIE